jgi:hypothetical protein
MTHRAAAVFAEADALEAQMYIGGLGLIVLIVVIVLLLR